MTIRDDIKKAGIKECTYYYRRSKGLSHEEALKPVKQKKAHTSQPVEKAPEVPDKISDETPEAVFAIFKEEDGLKSIYNGPIDKSHLFEISKVLIREANKINQLI